MTKVSVARPGAPSPDALELTLEALRSEIDGIDDELLSLIQQRQRLAGRVGLLKTVRTSALKIRPDREAAVISRRLARAAPEQRRMAAAIWRELMSAGLAAQGRMTVSVWSGPRADVRELARVRFGASADFVNAANPEAALAAAREKDTIAVLALDPQSDWWARLPECDDLWVIEGLARRSPLDPVALAVGGVDPGCLARGVMYRVSQGGGSGLDGAPERVLAASHGQRLCVSEDMGGPLDRRAGVIGTAAPF